MILYHYTNLDTLYSIIKNINTENANSIYFTLRATHAYFLNDMTEGQLLLAALKKIGADENLLYNLTSIMGYPFVVSLSELEDDLNMWRCYANQGKGVSIGLNKDVIEEAIKHQPWGESAAINKCQYVTEDELVEHLKSLHIKESIQDPDKKPLCTLLLKTLKFKNKSFIAEEEWRIYANCLESDLRVSDNLIIPYYNIQLPIEAITSITFGPKCDFPKNRFSTYRLLKAIICDKRATKIDLKQSIIPLI